MLSEVSVDEVFMHYFKKMSSASRGLAPRPLIAHPEKILRVPMFVDSLEIKAGV